MLNVPMDNFFYVGTTIIAMLILFTSLGLLIEILVRKAILVARYKKYQSVSWFKGERMIMPDTIKIGAHTYKVKQEDVPFLASGNTGLAGNIDLRGGEIRVVVSGTPESMVVETLLHEIIHGISFNRDIDLSEQQVDQVAAGLMALFVDNPKIVKLIGKLL